MFSENPIVVLHLGSRAPDTWTPKRFPRLSEAKLLTLQMPGCMIGIFPFSTLHGGFWFMLRQWGQIHTVASTSTSYALF